MIRIRSTFLHTCIARSRAELAVTVHDAACSWPWHCGSATATRHIRAPGPGHRVRSISEPNGPTGGTAAGRGPGPVFHSATESESPHVHPHPGRRRAPTLCLAVEADAREHREGRHPNHAHVAGRAVRALALPGAAHGPPRRQRPACQPCQRAQIIIDSLVRRNRLKTSPNVRSVSYTFQHGTQQEKKRHERELEGALPRARGGPRPSVLGVVFGEVLRGHP